LSDSVWNTKTSTRKPAQEKRELMAILWFVSGVNNKAEMKCRTDKVTDDNCVDNILP
jgi:hypothetical protein